MLTKELWYREALREPELDQAIKNWERDPWDLSNLGFFHRVFRRNPKEIEGVLPYFVDYMLTPFADLSRWMSPEYTEGPFPGEGDPYEPPPGRVEIPSREKVTEIKEFWQTIKNAVFRARNYLMELENLGGTEEDWYVLEEMSKRFPEMLAKAKEYALLMRRLERWKAKLVKLWRARKS